VKKWVIEIGKSWLSLDRTGLMMWWNLVKRNYYLIWGSYYLKWGTIKEGGGNECK